MAKMNSNIPDKSLEQSLWASVERLRGNVDITEYKNAVLGLIFLKYLSDCFLRFRHKMQVKENNGNGGNPDDPTVYQAESVFFVPEKAQWDFLRERAPFETLGKDIDEAMRAMEDSNPSLTGVFPKEYEESCLEKQTLVNLMDLIETISPEDSLSESDDKIKRVFFYFLDQFVLAEGEKGSLFSTPPCMNQLLIELLQPYSGSVFDPCCGLGGVFVKSAECFLSYEGFYYNKTKEFNKSVSVYGQEKNPDTWRLCKMNLILNGIESSHVKWNPDGSVKKDAHPDLKADFIIADPPFNDKKATRERFESDEQWIYGTPPVANENYAWIQHFISHLAPSGKAGFFLSAKSLASKSPEETAIRRGLIDDALPECMILLPRKLFYITEDPVCLWVLSKDVEKRRKRTLFLDATNIYTVIDRNHNKLSSENIQDITKKYHSWLNQDGTYDDIPGFCKSVEHNELNRRSASLYPGDYIGMMTLNSMKPWR